MDRKLIYNIFLTLLFLVSLFHVLIITQIIPYKIVWSGRIKTTNEMYVFETVSILINLLIIYTTLQKAQYIKQVFSSKIITASFWLFTFLFALNTLGNLFAIQPVEKILGTFLTLVSTIICWKIAKRKNEL